MHTCHIATGWSTQKSLLWVIKWVWDLDLFPSSQKPLTSNFHTFFPGILVFKISKPQAFFPIRQKIPSTPPDVKYEMIWYLYRPCISTNRENLSMKYTKNFCLIHKNTSFSSLNLWCKPPIVFEFQTQKKQRRLVLLNK